MGTTAAAAPISGTGVRRIVSIDVLRGLVLVVMVLDHVREYFSNPGINPTNPLLSWPALYLTRWVTHLCAPTFVFLAGVGPALQIGRGRPLAAASRLLLRRGLWLVILEVTAISFAWSFNLFPFFQVIWAIGVSMMLLSVLMRLPVGVLTALGVAVIGLADLLDGVRVNGAGVAKDVWTALHAQGFVEVAGHPAALMVYPLIPWFAVMILGYCTGTWLAKHRAEAPRYAFAAGTGMLLLFAVLRGTHAYGDPVPWQHGATAARTAMAFMNVMKNPPSLQFLLVTLGIAFLLWAAIERLLTAGKGEWLRLSLGIYGSVPFFFYLLHILLAHLFALLGTALFRLDWRWYLSRPPHGGILMGTPPGWNWPLPVVYAVWLTVVALLYLPCRWFSALRARRRDWWLSYL